KSTGDIGQGWYIRGKETISIPSDTRYVPGACTNCGATTHSARHCLERPKKNNAKTLGVRFAPDDAVQPSLDLSYDGKRDKYNGFDPSIQMKKAEQRKRIESEQIIDSNQNTKAEDDDGKQTKPDDKKKIPLPKTSLRVRHDTAKYLRNL